MPSDTINGPPAIQQCTPDACRPRLYIHIAIGNHVLMRRNPAQSLGGTFISRCEWLIPSTEHEDIRGGAVVLVTWFTLACSENVNKEFQQVRTYCSYFMNLPLDVQAETVQICSTI